MFHALTFGEAIKDDLLTDYQVVIIGVDQPMIADWIERGELVKPDSGEATDAKLLASQIGLIKAIKDYDLKRMISFHSRVRRAEDFAAEIHDTINFMGKEHRPNGILWTDTVSGKMSTHERRLRLDQLKGLTQGDIGLLSNARCLSEGVDVPSLDGVAFIDPRGSQVDIVQAVGRAIRLSENKTVGTIVLPVFIEDGDDAESSMQSSHFKPVWNVVNALKSHDEALSFELDKYRTNLGKKGSSSEAIGELTKIIVDLPQTIDTSFADSLKTFLVEKTTSSWNFWFGLLEVFVEEEGHARVPKSYKTKDGFKLGQWGRTQRSNKVKLTPERKTRLELLDGWVWDVLHASWEEGFSYLTKYAEQEGHVKVSFSYETEDGFKLGNWVTTQRVNRDKLTPERESRLESLDGWIWGVRADAWEEGFSYLTKYIEQEGHARVPTSYKTDDGFRLGSWVVQQRSKRDKLTPERESRLESLGFDWDPFKTAWEEGFSYLTKYVEQKGHVKVPKSYKTGDCYRLGAWVNGQRSYRDKLTPERKTRLESLDGWVWDISHAAWEEGFSYLTKYVEQEGHAKVPKSYKTADAYGLANWVSSQRSRRDKLTLEQISRLESLDGWVWDVLQAGWEEGFSSLTKYIEQEGHTKVPTLYKTKDGFKLGQWVHVQRSNRGKLTLEREIRLESLGFIWKVRK